MFCCGRVDGFDHKLQPEENNKEDYSMFRFSRVDDLYEVVIIYYRNNLDPDITILEQDMENDSESGDEGNLSA